MFKIGEIRELIRLLDETSVTELRIETDDMKLHMKKADSKVVEAAPAAAPIQQPSVPAAPAVLAPAPAAAPVSEPAPKAAEAPAQEDTNVHLITSPMVGTFYRSPSPDAPSYVEAGSKVGTKTVVCIVEAMKLMNEIEAEVNGEVVEVLAQNGQLVEYGQPLFKIRLS